MKNTVPDIAAMTAEERRAYFAPLFTPRTVAVVGASATNRNRANLFIDKLRALDFAGKIFPVHNQADEVEGMKAYPTLGDIPEPVDYAYVAIPAKAVPGAIAAAVGNVRFAHITAGGFADTEAGKGLQGELVAAAHRAGVRLLGPNCNGGYSPEGRLSMVSGVGTDVGPVAIISQSGGLSTDFIRRGQARGLVFRSVMALGNSADINPSDLLDFHLVDPKTKVIGLYLESIGDGRRLFETLKRAQGAKPVVLLKGGQTQDGSRAVSSHTGTLAGDQAAWTSLCKQTGTIMVATLDAFLDTLHGFQMFTPRPERPT
ncbi:MAG: CoA-binding protein, partial [Rhodospirillales bacterium]